MHVPRATTVAHRLAALPERVMREVVLAEELRAMHPAEAVECIDGMMAAARHERSENNLIALSALAGALERLGYAESAALYESAKASDLHNVARLFFSVSVSAGEAAPAPEQPVPGTGTGTGRKLTLGERKALARRGRSELLALLGDPDAAVIRHLLENPRATEKDVVTIAARRPAHAAIQRAIYASRWRDRYHVRRALVLNPGTPSDLALRLVPSLVESDLRAVAEDGHLSAGVRAQARLTLARPRPGR